MKLIGRPEGTQLLKDGVWVAGGHALAAIATLGGMRLITELAMPSVFGAFVLMNGILALFQGVLLQPMAQAAFRYYPDFAKLNGVSILRRHLSSVFFHRWVQCIALFAAACLIDVLTFRYLSIQTWFLLVLALGLESWKTVEIVMRNAACRQGAYAVLYLADSFGRPAGTVLVAWLLGTSLESLLLGQTFGVLLVLVLFARFSFATKDVSPLMEDGSLYQEFSRLKEGMRNFAWPLLWTPIVGWVSGLADRYIVGGMLGLAQAGIYSAAYGLASRPMLMIGSISDATLRQTLYTAVARGNPSMASNSLIVWIVVNLIIGTVAAGSLSFLAIPVVSWILAEEYRSTAAELVPWIAWGYVLLLLSQTVERFLYAKERTQAITLIQATSAAGAILGAIVGARWAGLFGVAVAVPFYLAVQFVMTTIVALRIRRLGS